MTISAHADGTITRRRTTRTVTVSSPGSSVVSRSLLAGSEAVQHLLNVEHAIKARSVPDAALLATVAFVCAMEYAATVVERGEQVAACAGDGEFGVSPLACRSRWLVEREESWFDYLNCAWPVMVPALNAVGASRSPPS